MGKARILIVDDSLSDVHILRMALDQHGEEYQLEIITDGAQALRFVHEHRTGTRKPEPCVILLDLHLPRYDGLSILEAIRETPALTHLTVLILTSDLNPREDLVIKTLGAHFRRKPMTFGDFVDLARDVIAMCKNEVPAAS